LRYIEYQEGIEMTLSKEEIYEDVITKLIACINKTDRKNIKSVKIRYLEREGLGARSEPPDKLASQIEFFPHKSSKMILTSIKIETEVFKP
jgi:hypothetical protein